MRHSPGTIAFALSKAAEKNPGAVQFVTLAGQFAALQLERDRLAAEIQDLRRAALVLKIYREALPQLRAAVRRERERMEG